MKSRKTRLYYAAALLVLAALAVFCGFGSFLTLETHRLWSLIFSVGYVLAWIAYTILARRMRFWNLLPLVIAGGTVLTIAEVLLLTYASVRLPVFLLLLNIAIAIPTLYPLLGFSGIDPLSAPAFLVIFLLASAAWCVICVQGLRRKPPADTEIPPPGKSEHTSE